MRRFTFLLGTVLTFLLCIGVGAPQQAWASVDGDDVVTVQKKKKKKKKFKKTKTKADPFLKSTWEMKEDMAGFNENYDDAKNYIVVLVNTPNQIVGKDMGAVAAAATDLPSEDLKGYFEQNKDAIKEVISSTSEVADNLAGLVESLATASTKLASMPGDAAELLKEGAELPDKLKSELTGFKAAKLPKALDAVSAAQTDLSGIQTEAPILAQNIAELVTVIKLILE